MACLGTMVGDSDFEGELGPHPGVSTEVICVLDFFGGHFLCDEESKVREEWDVPKSGVYQLMGGKPSSMPEKIRSASPLYYVDEKTAEFLVFHGTEDPVVDIEQSDVFVGRIEEVQGIDVPYVRIEGAGHGKGFGPTVYELVERYLDHQLHGEGEPLEDVTLSRDE